jgi:hypothetical protein
MQRVNALPLRRLQQRVWPLGVRVRMLVLWVRARVAVTASTLCC